jgi:hypothetical protein
MRARAIILFLFYIILALRSEPACFIAQSEREQSFSFCFTSYLRFALNGLFLKLYDCWYLMMYCNCILYECKEMPVI